uniref:Uncharacterized protein n=1 Tax=Parascaris equorum TaxID=6256 RepID=A0A914RS20_PAREQ
MRSQERIRGHLKMRVEWENRERVIKGVGKKMRAGEETAERGKDVRSRAGVTVVNGVNVTVIVKKVDAKGIEMKEAMKI